MSEVLTVKLPASRKKEMREKIRSLPGYISGTERDRHGYGRLFKSLYVLEFFKLVHKAFLAKSDGKADEFGNKWKPLKKSTIAQRPLRPGEYKKLGILGLGRSGRGLLTAAENRIWKGIFASNFAKLASRIGEGPAKALAAKLAWGIVKSRGAKTKIDVLGNRKVPILIVSGRLSKSLKPGKVSGETYVPSPEQVLDVDSRSVKMGSEVPYAVHQHKHRRLWPTTRQMARWAIKISKAVLLDIAEKMKTN